MRALVRALTVAVILSPLCGCRGQERRGEPSLALDGGPNSGDRYFTARPAFPWAETGPGKSFTLAGPSDSVPDRQSTFGRLFRRRGGGLAGGNSLDGVPVSVDSLGTAPATVGGLGRSSVSVGAGSDVMIVP